MNSCVENQTQHQAKTEQNLIISIFGSVAITAVLAMLWWDIDNTLSKFRMQSTSSRNNVSECCNS